MDVNRLQNFFKLKDLDIRKSNYGRFMDQKITPDILSIISDCIIEYHKVNKYKFTSSDIRTFEYSNENIKEIFNKPGIENKNTENEYDKFFSQPLKMLSYSGVLNEEKIGNKNYYTINDLEILTFISIKERNAYRFLVEYLKKVLSDSGLYVYFDKFFRDQTKQSFKSLKDIYSKFTIENTSIKKPLEPNRIFSKVLNPLSFYFKKHGTIRGSLSKDIICWNDLVYNRPNFRDKNKSKDITRSEYLENNIKLDNYLRYSLNKAKKLIHEYHHISEIHNKIAGKYNIHHIFPVNEYPDYSTYTENLIKLTVDQHYSEAHENGNDYINIEFQKVCVIKKVDTIEDFLNRNIDDIYSKECLIELLNNCLFKNIDLKVDESIDYLTLKYNIHCAYENL